MKHVNISDQKQTKELMLKKSYGYKESGYQNVLDCSYVFLNYVSYQTDLCSKSSLNEAFC